MSKKLSSAALVAAGVLAIVGTTSVGLAIERAPKDDQVNVYDARVREALSAKPAAEAATSGATARGERSAPLSAVRRASVGQPLPGIVYNNAGAIGPGGIVEILSAKIARTDDRYVVFETTAPLDPTDSNNVGDVYRLDTSTGDVVLASAAFGLTGATNGEGVAANPVFRIGAYAPAISKDGLKVAFNSGLLLNDTHDSFVWATDRVGGSSLSLFGGGPDGTNDPASDETFYYMVTFDGSGNITNSQIANVPGDALPAFGPPGAGYITGCAMSGNGNRLAFGASNANEGWTAGNEQNGSFQIYVFDDTLDQTFLVSQAVGGSAPLAGLFGLCTYGLDMDDAGNLLAFTQFRNGTEGVPAIYLSTATQPTRDILTIDISNPASPGEVFRFGSLPTGVTPSTLNNRHPDNGGPAFLSNQTAGGASGRHSTPAINSAGSKIAYMTNTANNAFTGANTHVNFYDFKLVVKDVSTGVIELVFENDQYATNAAGTGPAILGAADGNPMESELRFSGDDAALAFVADWNAEALGSSGLPADALSTYGTFSIDYPVSGTPVVESLHFEGTPTFANLNALTSAQPMLGATKNTAIFAVYDGVTFLDEGDSRLFGDLAVADYTQPIGSQIGRSSLGPVSGENANDLSARPAVSDDGETVAFVSYAANIVTDAADDANGASDVFLIDMPTTTTTVVSRDPGNLDATADGSSANPGNLGTTTYEYVMTGTGGSSVNQWHSISSIDVSGDGRYVVFPSTADLGATGTGLTSGDVTSLLGESATASQQLYRFDATDGSVVIASDVWNGSTYEGFNDVVFNPTISDNGQKIAFQSLATNYVVLGNDSTAFWNVGVRDLAVQSNTGTAYTVLSQARDGSQTPDGNWADDENIFPQISGDGNIVVWQSLNNILPADDDFLNLEYDIYLWDGTTDQVRLVSATDGNVAFVPPAGFDVFVGTPDGAGFRFDSYRPGLSNNGQFVSFLTRKVLDATSDPDANDVLPPTIDATAAGGYAFFDLYVYNDANRTTRYVDGAGNDGFRYANTRGWSRPSDDGRLVAFWGAEDFAASDTNAARYDLYVLDRVDGSYSLMSRNAGGDVADATVTFFSDTAAEQFSQVSISSDNRVVTFDSGATNLLGAGGDLNGQRDVYQVVLGTLTGGPAGAVGSWSMYE